MNALNGYIETFVVDVVQSPPSSSYEDKKACDLSGLCRVEPGEWFARITARLEAK